MSDAARQAISGHDRTAQARTVEQRRRPTQKEASLRHTAHYALKSDSAHRRWRDYRSSFRQRMAARHPSRLKRSISFHENCARHSEIYGELRVSVQCAARIRYRFATLRDIVDAQETLREGRLERRSTGRLISSMSDSSPRRIKSLQKKLSWKTSRDS